MATTRKTAASSRKPRTAARSASRPPTRAVEPVFDEPEVTEADAQELEADDNNYVTGDLCGEEVRMIPPGAWRQSWQNLLNNGQVGAFMEIVLHPGDLEVFTDVDPTNDEVGDLINDVAQRSGESLGKLRGPAPSSRRTRRR
ncbi:hypothetical protein MUK60_07195 [Streptomyces sp. LRE541]|uniref:hypothetical protein n=1 Tax=Streptomyces sp. LRE541 TaxID=2931983 RepID=UPI00201005EE|nr:hypothetical protein [Streptomyces sp. LRE541]UPZ27617.1 hypothetical protein MUK60_07195 [Streptomyces sp. LRE541]